MAVIANDPPAQKDVNPSTFTVIKLPAQDEWSPIDKNKKVFQPCNQDQDSEKTPLPTPETATEPPDLQPVQKSGENKRKRRRRSKKKKTVVVIKGPRSKSGIVSGKFHLTLPKKALGNRLLFIALCSFLHYQLAHSALNYTKSVPVSDFPIFLRHHDQNFSLQKPIFCPDKVHIFRSCTACFPETSLLEVTCSHVVAIDIWSKHGKINGDDGTPAKMNPKDIKPFVKKRHGRMTRSEKVNPGFNPKESKKSVEEKNENMTPIQNHDDICNVTVPVTDFPIVITQHDKNFTFHEAKFCPERDVILKRCSACFKNKSLLEISCRKNGDGDYEDTRVEHGKGRGLSNLVKMTPKECHKVENASKRQSNRPDGGTTTENSAGSKGKSLQGSGVFMIPFIFLAVILGFVIKPKTPIRRMQKFLPDPKYQNKSLDRCPISRNR